MKIHTAVGHYKANPETLFSLLSKEENLSKWATKFCTRVDKKAGDYMVTTTSGQVLYFKIEADARSGTIDMAVGPTKDQMWCGPHRVVSDNMGGSLFIFTFLQAPGQPEEEFDAGCLGLEEEFEVIRSLVD